MTTCEMVIRASPYRPEPKKVISYRRESHDSFTIRLDWRLDHGPGQFIFCSIPGFGEAPISICSHSDEYVELNIREVGNVTNALGNLKVGDELLVRGPYGTPYPMDAMRGKDVVFVGGGCGVAPLKGIIEYIEHNREAFGKVTLFLGFRTPKDTLFLDSLERWMDVFAVDVSFDEKTGEVPTVCALASEGFVTGLVAKNVEYDENTLALLCGPPIMIEKAAELLMDKGFSDEQLYMSAERLMYCGIGKCGRCMIHGTYTCLDGPVFRYDQLRRAKDD